MGRRKYTLEERVSQIEAILFNLIQNNQEHSSEVKDFIERLSPEVDTGIKCNKCSSIGTHRIKYQYRDGTDKLSDEVYCYECGERWRDDVFYSCKSVLATMMVKIGKEE